jgi:hypothetical protein
VRVQIAAQSGVFFGVDGQAFDNFHGRKISMADQRERVACLLSKPSRGQRLSTWPMIFTPANLFKTVT